MKIFGIGLNKTGTTSLSRAVEILGYRSVHYVHRSTSDRIERAILAGAPLHKYCWRPRIRYRVKRADAYLDVRAVEENFELLDKQYPGSRFILHTRDLDDWLESREKHVLRNQQRHREGRYRGSWLTVNRKGWIREWHKHHERVRAYFEDRTDDLLEIDITRGHGWDELAHFLDHAIPDVPFPHLNQSTKSRREGLRRLMVRVRRAIKA